MRIVVLIIACVSGLRSALVAGHAHHHHHDDEQHEHHHHHHHHHHVRRLNSGNGWGPDGIFGSGMPNEANGELTSNGKFHANGMDWESQQSFVEAGYPCRYQEPSPEELEECEHKLEEHKQHMDELIAAGTVLPRPWDMESHPGQGGLRGLQQTQFIDIKVYFNIIRKADGTGDVDDATIYRQIDVLNAGFAGQELYDRCGGDGGQPAPTTGTINTYIRFVLDPANIRRITNDQWFNLDGSGYNTMKNTLHQGTCSDINIYTGQTSYLGWAYFPPGMCSDGNVLDKRDGLVLNYQSLPKTNPQGTYEEGDTAVHEVGHWLGLPHTFGSASTCDDGDAVTIGDVTISDTPAEATAAFGCPIGRDSCPNAAGLDPIHNFMDYTNDCCMFTFTEKQRDYMVGMAETYRGLSFSGGPDPGPPAPPPPPPPPPTPTPDPTEAPTSAPICGCVDIIINGIAWFDSDGSTYNCEWYSGGANCATFGNDYENLGYTANTACCTCGGGEDTCAEPTDSPVATPETSAPTSSPTLEETQLPSAAPTTSVTSSKPSEQASNSPSLTKSSSPSIAVSGRPSTSPTIAGSSEPSITDSSTPSSKPSVVPTVTGSSEPSVVASGSPSTSPSTSKPSSKPSGLPTVTGSSEPSVVASGSPSTTPSTTEPSSKPSQLPTITGSSEPSMTLSSEPSVTVSTVPSSSPTISSTDSLSASPSPAPTQCSSNDDCGDNFFCAGRMQCIEAICQCVETPPPTSKAPSPNPTATSSNPPSEAISMAPSKAVTALPTSAPVCTDVVISIATDTWPEETTWYLVDASGGQVTADGPYSSRQTTYNTELCLSDDTYTFTIDDSYGDGIYGEGYSILVDGNVIATGNNFGSQAVETFIIENDGGGGGGTLVPTSSPTSTPTGSPTAAPTTRAPTSSPTFAETGYPSPAPQTTAPSPAPQTGAPSTAPQAPPPPPPPPPGPETSSPVAAPACTDVVISIATDTWPEETTWYLVDASGGQVTADGPYSSRQTTYNTELCLSDDTYTFTIDDSYGDGIYGEGYSILVDGNVIATGNNFGSQAVETFIIENGGGGATPPPPPPSLPTASPTTPCQCSDYDPSTDGWTSDVWYDEDGPFYDCAWYSQGTRCESYGNSYANFGRTANTACCACGSGGC